MRLAVVMVMVMAAQARAERHTVERGETLEHVAQVYGCSTAAILRANHVDTTLVRAGTVVVIPSCHRATTSGATTSGATTSGARTPSATTQAAAPTTADDRARLALAVIDGATVVDPTPEADGRDAPDAVEPDGLPGAERLPAGDGYQVRRPQRAFGEPHVVAHLQGAIAAVRALYPDVHTLAIGDLSAREGGKLAHHLSHQTGLDVDVGFYFHALPAGYPAVFVEANADLDLPATWALVTAFARTSHLPTGVEVMFLDRAVQKRLYDWARARGTPDDQLAEILQYPRPRSDLSALVHHWPNHTDHLHVRFRAAPATPAR